MKLSIHYTRGKSEDPNVLLAMGHNWDNINVSWAEAFELITVDGFATSSELLSDHRIGHQFASRQLLMIDIDNDPEKSTDFLTLPELLNHDFYRAYSAGFYATHSFTTEQHRYRVCFILEQAETNYERCRKIIRALLKIFPAGDRACKDPVRLFYGSPNCAIKECSDNILPTEIVNALVTAIDDEDQKQIQHTQRTLAPLTTTQQRKILELLKQTFVGEYCQWRDIGWGLKAGGYTLPDFQYVTTGMMRAKTPEKAAEVWNDGKQVSGGISMGTVIHFLKERHGKDCLNERPNWQAKRQELFDKYK